MDLPRRSIRWIWHPRVSGLSSFTLSMKLRHAMILGLVFLLGVVGYVAWCWRGYYLRPSMTFSENLPPDAVAMIEEWHQQDPLWGGRTAVR